MPCSRSPAIPPADSTPVRRPKIRPVPAVTRTIAILRLLSRTTRPLALKHIADETGMVSSTCLHILRALAADDVVEFDPELKRYRLGPGLLSLARGVIESQGFGSSVQSVLDRLSAKWRVTAMGVHISALERMTVLALARAEAPFSLHVDVGSRFPALASASGRLVAAFSRRPWTEIEARFKTLRWEESVATETWAREVERARRNHVGIDRGRFVSGVTLLAVPVFDHLERLTHTIVCAGVSSQLRSSKADEVIADMHLEAARLQRQLGC